MSGDAAGERPGSVCAPETVACAPNTPITSGNSALSQGGNRAPRARRAAASTRGFVIGQDPRQPALPSGVAIVSVWRVGRARWPVFASWGRSRLGTTPSASGWADPYSSDCSHSWCCTPIARSRARNHRRDLAIRAARRRQSPASGDLADWQDAGAGGSVSGPARPPTV